MSELPHADKSLGQHWLTDVNILDAIIDEAAVDPGDIVVEVGPGTGTLTEQLLAQGAIVTAIEFDKQLFVQLQNEKKEMFSEHKANLTLVNQDILSFDFTKVASPYKIVANIPYYLTSKLIRTISESTNPPEIAVLLVQKEVAQRVCAEPGKMSLLSVSAQYYWEASLGVQVPAKFFTPPPKVDSQTVILRRRVEPLFGEIDEKKFFRLVRAGFSNRRKTLLNSLSAGLQLDKEETKDLLDRANINPSSRPQELSLQHWHNLQSCVA